MTRWYGNRFIPLALVTLILAGCGTTTTTPTPAPASLTSTSTPAATVAPAPSAPAPVMATRRELPARSPDMTIGVRSDGWTLDRIEASEGGGRTFLLLRFEPLPGQPTGPHAESWFEASDNTYTIAVHGVRASNIVLRPGDVVPLARPPLRGYYALLVRDDTIFAIVVAAARPSASWSFTPGDVPGILRLTVETM
jgi:hypothetical protein